MPYVRRAADDSIVALLSEPADDALEFLPPSHPDIARFLVAGRSENQDFATLDFGFIRVMEDLIDVLIEKGVLRLTDLPPEAQRKLLARKGLRRRIKGALDLLGGNDVL